MKQDADMDQFKSNMRSKWLDKYLLEVIWWVGFQTSVFYAPLTSIHFGIPT